MRWESETFLVLFKGGRCRESPRCHLFVFVVNQGNEEAGWVYEFLLRLGMERLSLHLLLAVKNIVCASEVGCGGVYNL